MQDDLNTLAAQFSVPHGTNGHPKQEDLDTLWDSPVLNINMMKRGTSGIDDMSRLVYLLAEQKVSLPPMVKRVLPFGKELAQLHHGVGAAGDVSQLYHLYETGERLGVGSPEEIISLILRLLDTTASSLEPREKLGVYRDIELLHQEMLRPSGLNEFTELDVSGNSNIQEIPKFNSGFAPFDIVTGGFYQSLGVVMALPGTGKTSMLLTLMESFVKQGIRTWFYENEIPALPLQGRLAPMLKRTNFKDLGRVFCGPFNADLIESEIRADPDPERVVIFDSPDLQFSSPLGDRRLDLERDYQRLVLLKPLCKCILVASQPRRADSQLSMKSVAESWGKAWYADYMVTIERGPNSIDESTSMLQARTVKNRFGPNNQSIYYNYNYENMTWDLTGQDPNESWGDW